MTGAGSGIGKAIAQAFSDAGAAVCINWFKDYGEDAERHASQLPMAIAFEADVAEPEQVEAMLDAVADRFGLVDTLVNNAAIEKEAPLLDVDLDDWENQMRVNLRGPMCCLQAVARRIRDANARGAIVNISSIHEDIPFPGHTPYAVTKGGLRMLMRNAALELAEYDIRVNNIAPGAIKTPINAEEMQDEQKMALLRRLVPQQRMGDPEDVAQVALFLASDRSGYVTGSTYYVDGGMARYAEPV